MRRTRLWALALLGAMPVVLICVLFSIPPVTQDPEFHHFADHRTIFRIPNFWNVTSNLAFLVPAFWLLGRPDRWRSRLASMAILMIAVGSAYYHWAPDSTRLVWDRLPMTIVFMSVFAMAIQHLDARIGRWAFLPLIAIGIASVLYWTATGDLRFYGVVQFYPMIAVAALALFRLAPQGLTGMGVLYALSKLLELLDGRMGAMIATGGHPWKHVAAAAALLWFAIKRGSEPEREPERLPYPETRLAESR